MGTCGCDTFSAHDWIAIIISYVVAFGCTLFIQPSYSYDILANYSLAVAGLLATVLAISVSFIVLSFRYSTQQYSPKIGSLFFQQRKVKFIIFAFLSAIWLLIILPEYFATNYKWLNDFFYVWKYYLLVFFVLVCLYFWYVLVKLGMEFLESENILGILSERFVRKIKALQEDKEDKEQEIEKSVYNDYAALRDIAILSIKNENIDTAKKCINKIIKILSDNKEIFETLSEKWISEELLNTLWRIKDRAKHYENTEIEKEALSGIGELVRIISEVKGIREHILFVHQYYYVKIREAWENERRNDVIDLVKELDRISYMVEGNENEFFFREIANLMKSVFDLTFPDGVISLMIFQMLFGHLENIIYTNFDKFPIIYKIIASIINEKTEYKKYYEQFTDLSSKCLDAVFEEGVSADERIKRTLIFCQTLGEVVCNIFKECRPELYRLISINGVFGGGRTIDGVINQKKIFAATALLLYMKFDGAEECHDLLSQSLRISPFQSFDEISEYILEEYWNRFGGVVINFIRIIPTADGINSVLKEFPDVFS